MKLSPDVLKPNQRTACKRQRGRRGPAQGRGPAVRAARNDADGSARSLERRAARHRAATSRQRRHVPTLYLDVSSSTNGRTELANVYLRRYRRIAVGDQQDHGQSEHGRRNPRESGRRVPVHDHHERLRRRRGPDAVSAKAASATPMATARRSSSTAGAIRSISSAGRRASSPTSSSTPMNWTIRRPSHRRSRRPQRGLRRPTATTIRSICSASDAHGVSAGAADLLAGRDEDSGLNSNDDLRHVAEPERNDARPSMPNPPPHLPYVRPPMNPYGNGGMRFPPEYFGSDNAENTATDNIHNHLIATR